MLRRTTSFIAIATALGFSATVASAADIASSAYDWTGFYFGVNAGVAWNNTEVENEINCANCSPDFVDDLSGDDAVFTGGAMIGYNWQ
jgi:opacity protein-like surface antigen